MESGKGFTFDMKVSVLDRSDKDNPELGLTCLGLTHESILDMLELVSKEWNDDQDDLYTGMINALVNDPRAGQFIWACASQHIAKGIVEARKQAELEEMKELMQGLSGDPSVDIATILAKHFGETPLDIDDADES